MRSKTIRAPYDPDEAFGQQPAESSLLPNPEPLVANLTRCVIEILAGARELEQISRWVSDDVYKHLLKRVLISSRGSPGAWSGGDAPGVRRRHADHHRPASGVVEAVVVVNGRARTRAVAIRLEGLDRRWRATAIHVL